MAPPTHDNRPTWLRVFCDEPFRVFFPVGLLCGLVGVSHWLWYYIGLVETYSCIYHGLVQIQGFETAFAAGFLMTALPKFMEVDGARPRELFLGVGLLLLGMSGLYVERWALAEIAFLALILHILVFAVRRFPRRRDTPPPEFIAIPVGLIHALVGGLLILFPLTGYVKLGHRMVEQGMVLSFIMGIGPHLGPRLLGLPRPQRGVLSRDRNRLYLSLLSGALLMLSFWIEAGFSEPIGRILRALAVTVHLLWATSIYRLPARPLWHLRFLWLSFWSVIAGLWLAGLFPDYEVPALHITFVGGFTLLTFTIATRVIVAHCGFEPLWEKNSWAFVAFGSAMLFALVGRVASDFYLDYYFGMLHLGAGFWLIGALTWAVVFIPKLSPGNISEED